MRLLERVRESISIQDLARALGGSVDPDASLEITGVAGIEDAGPTEVTFLANPSYARKLKDSRAGALLVAPAFEGSVAMIPIEIENPYLAFARALALFFQPKRPEPGIHATAIVPESCSIGSGAWIGPYAVLGENVTLGDNVEIHPHAVVYPNATIGNDCVLHSHAVVREGVVLGDRVVLQNGAVLGADGFGFAPAGDGSWYRIPQAGTVHIADDVEVQAGACVDRATVGATTIGRGTKIDNLVQVGHGSAVGEDTLLCGQVGLAGSAAVGNRVILAGQVGVAGHLEIGDDVQVAAQSGVGHTLKAGGVYGSGVPAFEFKECLAASVQYRKLPQLARRLKEVERAQKQILAATPPAADNPDA